MNTADILDKAADLIDERGHHKGYYVDRSGALCLDGALYAAVGVDPIPGGGMAGWPGYSRQRDAEAHRVYVWLSGWMGGPETPIWWNDVPQRTKEEVVSTLRAAAQAARAEQ